MAIELSIMKRPVKWSRNLALRVINLHSPRWMKNSPSIHPIQFAFPNQKIPTLNVEKTEFFSELSPMGGAKKYSFFVEDDYYRHYAKAKFAVTMKKAGWDSLRHYEILASGTLPYFLDIEDCPAHTLFKWPKDLLTQVKKLPGMPKEWEVKWAMKRNKLSALKPKGSFQDDLYWELHKQLTSYFRENLTTQSLGDYFLEKSAIKAPARLLFCYGVHLSAVDYTRDLLMVALAGRPDLELFIYPFPFWHLQTCHRQVRNTLYGRGFTCTANLEDKDFVSPNNWSEVHNQLDTFDAIVACTSSNQGFEALPDEVQKSLSPRHDVIWVDGNDVKGNHEIPNCAKRVFRREMI